MIPDALGMNDAAAFLGVSPSAVLRMARDGRLVFGPLLENKDHKALLSVTSASLQQVQQRVALTPPIRRRYRRRDALDVA